MDARCEFVTQDAYLWILRTWQLRLKSLCLTRWPSREPLAPARETLSFPGRPAGASQESRAVLATQPEIGGKIQLSNVWVIAVIPTVV